MGNRANNHSAHEHGIDCFTFMQFQRPDRWAVVRDFMGDYNGTIEFNPRQESNGPHGGSGLRPDMALIMTEPIHQLDSLADSQRWPMGMRRLAGWLERALDVRRKIGWGHPLLIELLEIYGAGFDPEAPGARRTLKMFHYQVQTLWHWKKHSAQQAQTWENFLIDRSRKREADRYRDMVEASTERQRNSDRGKRAAQTRKENQRAERERSAKDGKFPQDLDPVLEAWLVGRPAIVQNTARLYKPGTRIPGENLIVIAYGEDGAIFGAPRGHNWDESWKLRQKFGGDPPCNPLPPPSQH